MANEHSLDAAADDWERRLRRLTPREVPCEFHDVVMAAARRDARRPRLVKGIMIWLAGLLCGLALAWPRWNTNRAPVAPDQNVGRAVADSAKPVRQTHRSADFPAERRWSLRANDWDRSAEDSIPPTRRRELFDVVEQLDLGWIATYGRAR